MRRIFWKSWSKIESAFELSRISSLPLKNKWVDANRQFDIGKDDIWLTTNGYDFKPGSFRKATLIWEGFTYLKNEYVRHDSDCRWDHRFHYNRKYVTSPKVSHLPIGTHWKCELGDYYNIKKNKNVGFVFGMVLGFKKRGVDSSDIGWLRQKVVEAGRGRSFRYYGTGWPEDVNCGGERYIAGARGSPVKFNDARKLMAPAKFVFAIENTYHARYSVDYLTEKVWHAFLSYSVPIYVGCYNVEDLLPSGVFIDFRKFDLDPVRVMDYCEGMSDSEYSGYLERIDEWVTGSGLGFSCDSRFLKLDDELVRVFG